MFFCSTLVGRSVFFFFSSSFFLCSWSSQLSCFMSYVTYFVRLVRISLIHFHWSGKPVWFVWVLFLGIWLRFRDVVICFFSHVYMSHVPSLSVCFVFSSSISIGLANQCDLDFFFSLHIFTSFFVCTLACSLSCFWHFTLCSDSTGDGWKIVRALLSVFGIFIN